MRRSFFQPSLGQKRIPAMFTQSRELQDVKQDERKGKNIKCFTFSQRKFLQFCFATSKNTTFMVSGLEQWQLLSPILQSPYLFNDFFSEGFNGSWQ